MFQLLEARAGAEWPPEVGAGARVETHQPHTVGRQPGAIAGGAERFGRRGDDPEDGSVMQREAIGGCRRLLRDGFNGAVVGLYPLEHFAAGDDSLWRPA